MKRKSRGEAEEAGKAETKPAAQAAASGRSAKSPKSRRKPKTTPEKAPHGFDFIGKVESLVVKGGSSAEVFEFGLRGRHGSRQTFRLKTSDSFSLNIIAPILTAAHAKEAKIGVRAVAGEGGVPYVVEVASRPKLGKAD